MLATLHAGFQFGWNVHTLAYALLVVVVVSGLYGVTVYVLLPRQLSRNRGETTQKQMLETLGALDRQILDAAQPLSEAEAAIAAAEASAREKGKTGYRFTLQAPSYTPVLTSAGDAFPATPAR